MAKKPLQQPIIEIVDLSPYMERDEDLGWLCNSRGMDLLLRHCKNYCSLGYKYIDSTPDKENECIYHMKFELGKI